MELKTQILTKLNPVQERGALKRIMAGICILMTGVVVLYWGNRYMAIVIERLSHREFGPMLFGSVFSVLIHGSQILLLLLGWVLIGNGAGYYFTQARIFVSIILSSVGIWLSWITFPLLHRWLTYTFPLEIYILVPLLALFELLTLQVENWIDRGAAISLWVYSLQSLELLPAFPTSTQALSNLFEGMYRSNAEVAIASMAGTSLFLSFLAGAITSTWLLARYSIRLSQVRQLWQYAPRRKSDSEDGLLGVNMVDVRSLVHDLKNPLAAIKAMALLLREEKGGEAESEKADVLLKATSYMEHMINEILHEDQRSAIVTEKFFDNLEKHIHPFPWGEYVHVTLSPDVREVPLKLNEIRFMRALLNVLDNAWRANRTAGTRDIDLHVRRNAQFVEIEILDNGPGYAPLSNRSGWGSTGLGLAFVRRIVTAHQGNLLISSRTDGISGASVLISVPVSND
ncbi:MAG: HAMP domain-containing histidine kinase [Synergistaceae bacterium]|nr:HAMP domain-containing histidine kinase [Synergistaceae bacterium]